MAKTQKTIDATAETVAVEDKPALATPFAGFFQQGRDRYEDALKKVTELRDFAPRGYKALVAGTQAATKGIEGLNAENLAFGKNRIDVVVETTKKLVQAKSLKEVFDLQSTYAKSAVEAYIAQTKKVGEMAKQVATDSVAPVKTEMKAIYDQVTGKAA